jgi:hypothetical protein
LQCIILSMYTGFSQYWAKWCGDLQDWTGCWRENCSPCPSLMSLMRQLQAEQCVPMTSTKVNCITMCTCNFYKGNWSNKPMFHICTSLY